MKKATTTPLGTQFGSPNSMMAIRRDFLIQLLTGIYKNRDEIDNRLKTLEIKLNTEDVAAVLLVVDDYANLKSRKGIKDESVMEFAVVNIVQEILDDFKNGVVCHLQNEKFLMLLSFQVMHSMHHVESRVNTVVSRTASCLKKFLNLSVSFAVGDIEKEITGISKSYVSAEKLLEKRFFEGNGCILRSKTEKVRNEVLTGLGMEAEKNSCQTSGRIILKVSSCT